MKRIMCFYFSICKYMCLQLLFFFLHFMLLAKKKKYNAIACVPQHVLEQLGEQSAAPDLVSYQKAVDPGKARAIQPWRSAISAMDTGSPGFLGMALPVLPSATCSRTADLIAHSTVACQPPWPLGLETSSPELGSIRLGRIVSYKIRLSLGSFSNIF